MNIARNPNCIEFTGISLTVSTCVVHSEFVIYISGSISLSRQHTFICGTCLYLCINKCSRASESDNLFFYRLNGARNVDCNDQQEGGNGIDIDNEHSRQLPRCHTGWTCRAECEVFRQLRQHRTQLPRMAGTAAQGFPNRTSSSCHQ